MKQTLLLPLTLSLVSGCEDQKQAELELRIARLEQDIRELKSEQRANSRQLHAADTPSSPSDKARARVSAEMGAVSSITYYPDGSWRDDPYAGSKDKKVILMMFNDFESTNSKKFVDESLPTLREEFIEKDRLRFIVRDFPLQSHPHAVTAATLSHCAGEQGSYWEVFDYLFSNQESLSGGDIEALLADAPVADQEKLSLCVDSNRYLNEIKADVAEGEQLGARGAPSFFLGKKTPRGEFEGTFIRGAQPLELFVTKIDSMSEGE